MSVVMQEIERRKEAINSYDAKVEKSARLKAEAEQLDKEIAETDIGKIQAEIYELTEDAKKLGYIEVETEAEEESEEKNAEVLDNSERAASVFTQSI